MRVLVLAVAFALIAMSAAAQAGPGHDVPRDTGPSDPCGQVDPNNPCYGLPGGGSTSCAECYDNGGVSYCDPDGEPYWANCRSGESICWSMPGGGEPECQPACGDRCSSI